MSTTTTTETESSPTPPLTNTTTLLTSCNSDNTASSKQKTTIVPTITNTTTQMATCNSTTGTTAELSSSATSSLKTSMQCITDSGISASSFGFLGGHASWGLDLMQVLSDDKHYRTFVCGLCGKLLALDAVVTQSGSHAYCWTCFQQNVVQQTRQKQQQNRNAGQPNADQPIDITCPRSGLLLSIREPAAASGYNNTMQVRVPLTTDTADQQPHEKIRPKNNTSNGEENDDVVVHQLAVQPLKVAQPMAYQAMSLIQVTCSRRLPGNSEQLSPDQEQQQQQQCSWSGNYGDYPQYLERQCQGQEYDARGTGTEAIATQAGQDSSSSSPQKKPRRSSLQRINSMPSLLLHKPEPLQANGFINNVGGGDVDHQQPQLVLHAQSPDSPGHRNSTGHNSILSPISSGSSLSSNARNPNVSSTTQSSSSGNTMKPNPRSLLLRKSLSLRNFSRDSANDFPPPTPHRTSSPYETPSMYDRSTALAHLRSNPKNNHNVVQSLNGQSQSLTMSAADVLPSIPRWEDSRSTVGAGSNNGRNGSGTMGTTTELSNKRPLSIPEHGTGADRIQNGQTVVVAADNEASTTNKHQATNTTRDMPPNMVKRTISGIHSSQNQQHQQHHPLVVSSVSVSKENTDPAQLQQQEQEPTMNTSKPVPEDKQLRRGRRKSNQPPPGSSSNGDDDEDSMVGDGENLWGSGENWANTSINSLTAWGSNTHTTPSNLLLTTTTETTTETTTNLTEPMDDTPSYVVTPAPTQSNAATTATATSRSTSGQTPSDSASTTAPHSTISSTSERSKAVQVILIKAEKLKKQANAKFNKGDFNVARVLYTDGIRCMEGLPNHGPKEDEMLSNMHSNRAVTYFRDKNFFACIQDCDVALQYDPYYEKSWIRKWRALMALGQFERALECLENGMESLPDCTKIRKELQKSQADMEMVQNAKDLLFQKRDYMAVKDMLKSQIKNAAMDNIAVLHLAARADAYLGLMDSSIDKINRALRYNPHQPDGLAVRGAIMYLAGETDKGLHLLQDAYVRDKENRSIKTEAQQCHRTHTSLSKGRSCVKRGRYLDAVEHFTAAIREKTLVPEKTPLYAMVRCERAEAWMLSQKYLEALKDCGDVINAQEENATAWTIRAEILIAMGKAEEAQKELLAIRKKPWGMDNATIEEGFRRVDFELRVQKADQELTEFVATLEQGLGNIRPVTRRESSDSIMNNRGSAGASDANAAPNREQRRASMGSRASGNSGVSNGGPPPADRRSERGGSGTHGDPQQQPRRGTRRKNQSRSMAAANPASDVPDSVLLSPSLASNGTSNNKHNTTNGSTSNHSPPSTPQRRLNSKAGAMRRGASSRHLSESGGADRQQRRQPMERQASSRKMLQQQQQANDDHSHKNVSTNTTPSTASNQGASSSLARQMSRRHLSDQQGDRPSRQPRERRGSAGRR